MNTTTIAESFSAVGSIGSRSVPVVYAENRKPVSESIQSLIQYLVLQLNLDNSLDVAIVNLSNIKSVDTGHSHRPGVLMRQCGDPNAVGIIVKTLDSTCFVCQMIAQDSDGQEIRNSKLLASIREALDGENKFYVTEKEIREFQTRRTLAPRQAPNNGEEEKKPGILPLSGLLDNVTVLDESSVSPAGSTNAESGGKDKIPANLFVAVKTCYRLDDLLQGLRDRSQGGKIELLLVEVVQVAREILALPEPKDRFEAIRFIRALLKLRFLKRIGKELPARYKVIGFSFDPERGVARLRPVPNPSPKSDSPMTEGGEGGSGFAGQIAKLESMADKFRRSKDEIVKVCEELQVSDKRLEEHEVDKTRISAIEAEIKKLSAELDLLNSKPNIRGIYSHREALLRQQAELEATLNSQAHQAAESKLAQLKAIMTS